MRDFAVVKDPQVGKLFGCATRRGILYNLARREMTPGQLAKVLNKPISSMIYHLEALEKAGLVELSRTAQRGNLVEKYFTATARRFIISYTLSEGLVPGSEDTARWTREVCRQAASGLEAFGYELPERQLDLVTRLLEHFTGMENAVYERIVSRQRSPTRIEQPSLKLLMRVLAYHELAKSPEFHELMNDLAGQLSGNEGRLPGDDARNQATRAGVLEGKP